MPDSEDKNEPGSRQVGNLLCSLRRNLIVDETVITRQEFQDHQNTLYLKPLRLSPPIHYP